jgi:hypothetical protein
LDVLAARAAAEGRLGPGGISTTEAIRGYFGTSLRYKVGDRELAGLRRFHTLCVRHDICPAGRGVDLAATD